MNFVQFIQRHAPIGPPWHPDPSERSKAGTHLVGDCREFFVFWEADGWWWWEVDGEDPVGRFLTSGDAYRSALARLG